MENSKAANLFLAGYNGGNLMRAVYFVSLASTLCFASSHLGYMFRTDNGLVMLVTEPANLIGLSDFMQFDSLLKLLGPGILPGGAQAAN